MIVETLVSNLFKLPFNMDECIVLQDTPAN
jgi:hypothetical protein